jgi:hypothetical protein
MLVAMEVPILEVVETSIEGRSKTFQKVTMVELRDSIHKLNSL